MSPIAREGEIARQRKLISHLRSLIDTVVAAVENGAAGLIANTLLHQQLKEALTDDRETTGKQA